MKQNKRQMMSYTLQQLKDVRCWLKRNLPPEDYDAFNQICRKLLDPCSANKTDISEQCQQIAKYVDAFNNGKRQPWRYMMQICKMHRINTAFCRELAKYIKQTTYL